MEMDMKIRMGLAVTGWCMASAMALAQGSVMVGTSVVTMPLPGGLLGGFPAGVDYAMKGQPYSMVEKTTTVRTLADGTTMRSTHEERKMRDAEGRMRVDTMHEFKGETTIITTTVSDPVARTRTTLNVRQKMAYTFHLPELKPAAPPVDEKKLEELRAAAKSRPVPNFQMEKLGQKSVSGIFAEGTRTTRVIPIGLEGNDREIRVVTEQWVSPDLKIVVARSLDDPRYGQSTMEVSELQRGDPEAALFQVPADYKMVVQPPVGAVQ
jgi:hypothetical protein